MQLQIDGLHLCDHYPVSLKLQLCLMSRPRPEMSENVPNESTGGLFRLSCKPRQTNKGAQVAEAADVWRIVLGHDRPEGPAK